LHYRSTNGSGYVVYTNIYPDGGVSVTTLHKDGSTLSVSGTATHPMQYLYGVDGDGALTTEIKVASDGGTKEWKGVSPTESLICVFHRIARTISTAWPHFPVEKRAGRELERGES
jgi:hypothetical protein